MLQDQALGLTLVNDFSNTLEKIYLLYHTLVNTLNSHPSQ